MTTTKTLSRVFVGSLTRETRYFRQAHGEGITVLDLDEETGVLTRRHCVSGTDNPTFLAVDRAGCHLYATSEVFGWNEGTVTAYAIDDHGGLRYLNKQPSLGSITAHCSLDGAGGYLLAANYAHEPWGDYGPDLPGQAVAVFAVRQDGGLLPAASSVRHSGSGPVPQRQTCPHPHCVVVSPDGRFAVVTDLGTDRLHSYRFADGVLTTDSAPLPLALPAGSGPRTVVFGPTGRRAYLTCEMTGSIACLDYDTASGGFAVRQIVSVMQESYTGANDCADVHLSPDGRFLYGSVRGQDSIAAFRIDEATGALSAVGHVPVGGASPRSFAISATGRFLLAANQNSDTITVFRRDGRTGGLEQIGSFAIGTPMFVGVQPL